VYDAAPAKDALARRLARKYHDTSLNGLCLRVGR
jgi:hypothetical protein